MSAAVQEAGLGDEQLLRYNRQIMLPQIGVEGQERLLAAHVLLLGLGGLGSPLAMYLAACGVGRLTLIDSDRVELANLQRQILYRSSDLGAGKAERAFRALADLNPEVRVDAVAERADLPLLRERLRGVDLAVDATDNFETRQALNRACVEAAVPLVSGAVVRMEGQVAVFRNRRPGDACYRCLFGAGPAPAESCAESGVLGPVAGAVAGVQAAEAVKCLLELGAPLYNRLLLYDALRAEWKRMELTADPACPVCAAPRAGSGGRC